MIDLGTVRTMLEECSALVEELDGRELDESTAVGEQGKGVDRKQRAQLSQSLSFLADRLELASNTVRSEYWAARGRRRP